MNRTVGTSVEEITEELNELFDVAGSLCYIDVGMMARSCKDSLNILNALITEHPECSKDIKKYKAEVEVKALQLEYYIQCYTNKYRERYKLRAWTTVFEEDVRMILLSKVSTIRATGNVIKPSDDVNVDALKWLDYYRFATRLKTRSNHIVFSISSDEEHFIKVVSNDIKIYKSEHPEEFGGKICVES